MSFDNRLTVIGKHRGYDREDITVDNTAGGVGFDVTILNTSPAPKRIYVTCESAQCRFTYDGTAPTTSLGHVLNPMDSLYVEGLQNMRNFRAIRTGTTSAKLVCTYEI